MRCTRQNQTEEFAGGVITQLIFHALSDFQQSHLTSACHSVTKGLEPSARKPYLHFKGETRTWAETATADCRKSGGALGNLSLHIF